MNTSRISPNGTVNIDDVTSLLGYCNATDTDGNGLVYYYRWFVNSALYATGTFGDLGGTTYASQADEFAYDSGFTNGANAGDADYSTYAYNAVNNTNITAVYNYSSSKPSSTNSTTWELKHGTNAAYNITLPTSCWNQSTMQLRMWSQFLNTTYANGNGTTLSSSSLPAACTCAWTNPTFANKTDNFRAYAFTTNSGECSKYLNATNFGFSIPSTATINGIQVTVEYNTTGSNILDRDVFIVKGGMVSGTNHSAGATWASTGDANVTYGNSTDLWGLTWTPSDINSTGFGFAQTFRAATAQDRYSSIDWIGIRVYYSIPTYSSGAECYNGTTWLNVGTTDNGTSAGDNYVYDQAAYFNRSIVTYAQGVEQNVANITSGLAANQNWTLECRADDGTTTSSRLNSSNTTIVSLPPSIAAAYISNNDTNNVSVSQSNTSKNLTAWYNTSQASGVSTSVYAWSINNTPYALQILPFDINISSTTAGAITDYSGNNKNATIMNLSRVTWNSTCVVGGCYMFNGSNSNAGYIHVPDVMTSGTTTGFTIEAWINPRSVVNDNTHIAGKDNGNLAVDRSWGFMLDTASRLKSNIFDTSGADTDISTLVIPNNTWTHVALVYNGTNVIFYRNGTANSQTSSITAMFIGANNISIGRRDRSADPGAFNGSIDQLMIYNRTLSAAEIAAHYNLSYNRIVTQELVEGQNWNVSITPLKSSAGGTAAASNLTFITNYVNECQPLSTAGATLTLTFNSSVGGYTCFNITAANVTLDCAGFSITGINASGTYGIYSTAFNTTVKNCIISNFSHAIYFNGANNGTIQNTTTNTTAANSYGIYLSSSSNNSISNSTGTSLSSYGIGVISSNFNNLNNITAASTTSIGIFLTSSNNNSVSNSNFRSNSTISTIGVIRVDSSNNSFSNNTANSTNTAASASRAIYLNGATFNVFSNNTLIAAGASTPAIQASSDSGNNTFYQNNITANVWVNNSNETNQFNTTISSKGVGNIYYNSSGDGAWTFGNGTSWSDTDSNSYADTGTLPLNATTFSLYWAGVGGDYFPFTTNSVSLVNCHTNSTAGAEINLTSNMQINASACFNLTAANISLNCAGYNITGNSTPGIPAIFINASNVTVRNCQISNFSQDISISGSTISSIINITGYSDFGIVVNNTNNSIFQNLAFNNTANKGIYVTNSSQNNTFTQLSINATGSGYGIYADSSSNNNTFDCAGGLINGSNTAGISGIYANNLNAIVVRNCRITNFQYGIDFPDTDASTIQSNNVTNSYDTGVGIYAHGSGNTVDSNLIDRNIVNFTSLNNTIGIYLYNGGNANNITNNNASGYRAGHDYGAILVSGVTNTMVENNTASMNGTLFTDGAIRLTGTLTGTIVRYNNATNIGAGGGAITTQNAANVIIENNTVFSTSGGAGIQVSETNNNVTVRFNTVNHTGSGYGIQDAGDVATSGLWIYNNTVNMLSGTDVRQSGFLLNGLNNIWVENNTVYAYNKTGAIEIGGNLQNRTILHNTFISNYSSSCGGSWWCAAVLFNGGRNANLTNNTIRQIGTARGIHMMAGDTNNTVSFNTINASAGYGIHLQDVAGAPYGNSFLNNTINASSTGFYAQHTGASPQTFLGNTIQAAPWIDNSNASNIFNNSNSGNTYYFTNGTPSWNAFGIFDSDGNGFADVANDGSLPFNATTVGSTNWSVNGSDYHPYTTNTRGCANLSTVGQTYTLVYNLSISGQTCMNISASNVTLDCAGYSITGNNTTATYGVYSNAFNTTIKNCVISNFSRGIGLLNSNSSSITNNTVNITIGTQSGVAFYFDSSDYLSVRNNSAYTVYYAMYLTGADFGLFDNNTLNATTRHNLYLVSSTYNNISNSILSGTSDQSGLRVTSGSNFNQISNITLSGWNFLVWVESSHNNSFASLNISGSACKIQASDSSDNNFTYINTTGISALCMDGASYRNRFYNSTLCNSSSDGCVALTNGPRDNYFYNVSIPQIRRDAIAFDNSHNNTWENSTISHMSTALATGSFRLVNGAQNNTIRFNTINLSGGTIDPYAIYSDSASGLNLVYGNNITAIVWVNNSNSTNQFNTSSVGNIYYFTNGSGAWNTFSIFDGDSNNYADAGTDRPFNATTVGGNWSGLGGDWYPFSTNTRGCANLSTVGQTYTLAYNLTISGQTCINISAANVTLNCNGYSITGDNTTSTYGVYATGVINNITVKNCLINNFSTGIYYYSPTNGLIHNNTINGTFTYDGTVGGCGISVFRNADNTTISNNTITTTGGAGICIHNNNPYLISKNVVVENNTATATTGYGISLSDANATVRFNTFNATTSGIGAWLHVPDIYRPHYLIFANNTVESNSSYALWLYNGQYDGTIANNTAKSNQSYAIALAREAHNNTIEGNTINQSYYGIGILDVLYTNTNNTIRNNFVNTTSSYALLIQSQGANNTISNNSFYSVGQYGVRFTSSDGNNLANNTIGASSEHNLLIEGTSANNTIENNTFTTSSNYKADFTSTGTGNVFRFNNFTQGAGAGAISAYGNNWLIHNNTVGSGNSLIILSGSAANNTIANTTKIGNTGDYLFSISTSGNGNVIYGHSFTGGLQIIQYTGTGAVLFHNNSLTCTYTGTNSECMYVSGRNLTFANNTVNYSAGSAKPAIRLMAVSSNNTFYGNNITSNVWVDNANETNMFNTTIDGKGVGNIYHFPNGTGAWETFSIYDTDSNSYADAGADRPFNATTVGGNWSGLGGDWYPFSTNTRGCANLSTVGQTYTLAYNLTISGQTCINISAANITLNCNGYSITGDSTANTAGAYSNAFNTTVKNCIISNFSTGIDLEYNSASAALHNITNNTLINNSIGIDLQPSSGLSSNYNSSITGNNITCSASTCTGINMLQQQFYLAVSSNSITAQRPIYHTYTQNCAGPDGSTFSSNIINATNSSEYGITIGGLVNAFTIRNNNISGIGSGISGSSACDFINISSNTINVSGTYGIYSIGEYATVYNNTVDAGTYSVYTGGQNSHSSIASNTLYDMLEIYRTDYHSVSGNTIIASNHGIQLEAQGTAGSNNNFTNNNITVTGAYIGIALNGQVSAGGYNNTIDCQGASITGNNTSASYGIYSNMKNTTVKNCVISNFSSGIYIMDSFASDSLITNNTVNTTFTPSSTAGIGIWLYSGGSPAQNSTVSNNNVNSSGYGIYLRCNGCTSPGPWYQSYSVNDTIAGNTVYSNSASYPGIVLSRVSNVTVYNNTLNGLAGISTYVSYQNNFEKNTISVTTGNGISLDSGNSTILNNSITATSGKPIHLSGTSNLTVANNNISSSTSYGIGLVNGWNYLNLIENNTVSASGESASAIYISEDSTSNASKVHNNTIRLNTLNSSGSSGYAIYYSFGLDNNFTNNTLSTASSGTGFYASSSAGTGLAYYNNFTGSGKFVDNSNSTNQFNTSVGGVAQGNFYHNISSYSIFDSDSNSWGDAGSAYPLNSTNAPGAWAGSGADFGPASSRSSPCANLSTPNTIYTLGYNLTTTGTCFNVTAANVTIDGAGYSITGANNSGFYGVLTNATNTTVKNLIISNFSYGIYASGTSSTNCLIQNNTISSTFAGGHGIYIHTGSQTNQYCRITANNITTTTGNGIDTTWANANNFTNNTFTATSGSGIATRYAAISILVYNNTVNANSGTGLEFDEAASANISFNTISTHGFGLTLQRGGSATAHNNTITSKSHTAISIASGSNSNKFYHNTIKAAKKWVEDSASGTQFNTTGQGNFYVGLNLYDVTDGNSDGWGDGGTQYPVNSTTISAKWSGSGTDYAPRILLSTCANLATASQTLRLYNNISVSSSTCFNLTAANVLLDCDGFYIIGNNAAGKSAVNITSSGATVKNCHFANWSRDIVLTSSSSNALVFGNFFNGSTWVDNSGTTNMFNRTINGVASGNYYPNLSAYDISDSNGNGFADSGTAHPISSSTAPGAWSGSGSDGGAGHANTTSCGVISVPDTYLLLSQNLSISNANCFNITAAGVTLDCNGYTLSGNNASGTYGVYTTGAGAIVKNCRIQNFSSGIYIYEYDARFSTIINNTITTTFSGGHGITSNLVSQYRNAYNTYSSNTISTTSGYGVYDVWSNYNTITGNSITAGTGPGISINFAATGDQITSNTINSTSGIGIFADEVSAGSISLNNVTANSTALYTSRGGSSTTITNNTLTSLAGTALWITSPAFGNYFSYHNTLSGVRWVNDTGSNHYNTTVGGVAQGNYYPNTTAYLLTDSNGDFWADGGTDYPFNATTLGSLWIGTGADWGPAMHEILYACKNLNVTNMHYLGNNVSINGSTCFNITAANVTLDCRNYSITGNNTTATYGVYTNNTNITVKNCRIANFSSGIFINGTAGVATPTNMLFLNNTFDNNVYGVNSYQNQETLDYNITNNTFIGANGISSSSSGNGWGPNGWITNNTFSTTGTSSNWAINIAGIGTMSIQYNNITGSSSGYALYHTNINRTGSFNTINVSGYSVGNVGGIFYNNTIHNGTLYIAGVDSISGGSIIANNTFNTNLWFYRSGPYNITNNVITASGADAIRVDGGDGRGDDYVITNNAITVSGGSGIYLPSTTQTTGDINTTIDCQGATITGNNTTSTYGVYAPGANISVKNCIISNFTDAIRFDGADSGNITNNTLNTTRSGGYALNILAAAENNSITNNTLNAISPATTAAIFSSSSSNNLFYYNNITSQVWVNNSNSTNQFNTTIDSKGVGNIYYFANGTGAWNTFSIFDGDSNNYADAGTDRPFNATTVGGNWSGLGGDWYPFSTNTRGCANLSTVGQTYTLAYNLTISGQTCINISAANVTLDCGGYSITGNNTASTYGAYTNATNSTIKNCIISNFSTGIFFDSLVTSAANGTAQNNTINITYSTGHAIYGNYQPYYAYDNNATSSYRGIYSGSGGTLARNTISAISLALYGYNNGIYQNNTATSTGNDAALYVLGSNNLLDRNNATSSAATAYDRAAIRTDGSNNNITNNIANGTGGAAYLAHSGASNNLFINNTAYVSTGYGVYLFTNSNNNSITNISITATGTGSGFYSTITSANNSIDCQGGQITGGNGATGYGAYSDSINTTIKNCIISSFPYGIYLTASVSSTITNNTVTTNGGSFDIASISLVSGSNSTVVANNTANNTNAGPAIYIQSSIGNNLTNNTAIANAYSAILIYQSSTGNVLSLNNATSTSGHGIFLYLGPSSNTIANNTVTSTSGNGIQVSLAASNTISENNATSTSGSGIIIDQAANSNTLSNNIARTASSSGGAIAISSSTSVTLTDNTANNTNGGFGLYLSGTITGGQFNRTIAISSSGPAIFAINTTNGTISNGTATGTIGIDLANSTTLVLRNITISATGTALRANSTSSSNQFFYNNITSGTPIWINDSGTGNQFNTTVSGHAEGNIYHNISSYIIYDSDTNGWGDTGSAYPLNSANAPGVWIGNGADYGPYANLTRGCANITTEGQSYLLAYNVSISGQTCMNISAANVTLDCNGFSITGSNTTATYGVYTNSTNTTIKNCIISNFSEGIQTRASTDDLFQNNTITTTFNGGTGIHIATNSHRANISGITITNGNASGIYIDGGQNTTVDCQGNLIQGSNTTDSYGIYTNQFNTSTKNCIINNYYDGIYYFTTDNGTIQNTSITISHNSGHAIYIYNNANYNSITNSSVNYTGVSGFGIYLLSSSNNSITDSTTRASLNRGVYFSGSSNNSITNITCISSSYRCIELSSSSNNLITGSSFTSNCSLAAYRGLVQIALSNSNIFANNTINSTNTANNAISGIYIESGNLNNFTNNTIIAAGGTTTAAIRMLAASANNLFYQNNITARVWINNSNSTNMFNTTIDSKGVGNIYYFTNGTGAWNTFNIIDSDSNNYADAGTDRPFNATTVGGNWSGVGGDWYPFTNVTSRCGVYSTAGQAISLSANETTTGTCFNITAANVTLNCAGYSITGSNASGKYGVISTAGNTTVRNCIISNFSEGIYLQGSTVGTLNNNTINLSFTNGSAILLNLSSQISVSNSTLDPSFCLKLSDTNDSLFANLNCLEVSNRGFWVFSNSHRNNFTNFNITISSSGHGIYVDGGSNNSFDCQGGSITGKNTSSHYGAYSSQFNTTVKNCVISNFTHGVYFDGAENGLIQNNSVNVTRASGVGIYLFSNANNNIVQNNTAFSLASVGIRSWDSSNVTLANNNGTSTSYAGIQIYGASNSNITGNIGTSTSNVGFYADTDTGNSYSDNSGISSSGYGIFIPSAINSNYTNMNGTSTSNYGVYFYPGNAVDGYDNRLVNITATSASSFGLYVHWFAANNSFTGGSAKGTYALAVNYSSTGNNFTNMTLNGTIANIYVDSTSGNNLFYYNNITGTGIWVNNSNSTNQFNTTVAGFGQGNNYSGIDSYDLKDTNGDYYADTGASWPINATTAPTKWMGNGSDFGPWISRSNRAPNLTSTFTGAEAGTNAYEDNLTGYWRLDEHTGSVAYDTSGNNLDGTLTSITFNESGRVGRAYTFNGASSNVKLATSSLLNITNNITISAWVFLEPSSGATVVHKGNHYSLHINADRTITWADSSNWSYSNFSSYGSVPLANWTLLTATKNGSFVSIYMNGILVVNKTFGSSITTDPSIAHIGCYAGESGGTACNQFYFNGSIDDVRIYNSTLNSTEILSIHNQTAYTYRDLAASPSNGTDADNNALTYIHNWYVDGTPYAILNMPFDSNVSTTVANAVKDYSGYGSHGTIAGAATWNASGKYGGAYTFGGGNITTTNTLSSFATTELWCNNGTGWAHVVNASGTVYVNGSAGTAPCNPIQNVSGKAVIGAGFTGSVDGVLIYSSTLSAEEIAAHYNLRYWQIKGNETQINQNWTDQICANDGYTDSVCRNSSIYVYNSIPYAINVSIKPQTVYRYTNMMCNATINDKDRTPTALNLTYNWYMNSTLNASGTYNNTAKNTETAVAWHYNHTKGSVWACGINITDGTAWSGEINSTNITVLNSIPTIANMTIANLTQFANTTCRVNVSDGDGQDDIDSVRFTITAPNGTVIVNNQPAAYLGGTGYSSPYFNLSANGTWNCSATANDTSSASVELNGSFLVEASWQAYYGPTAGRLLLGSGMANYLLNWTATHGISVFVAEPSVTVNWSQLTALGTCPNGTIYNQSNNFEQADAALGIPASYSNSIRAIFDSNNNSIADSNSTFSVFGRNVSNVPTAKITPASAFSTGIFYIYSTPTTCYSGVQDLVFAVKINASQAGTYGVADYEVMIPQQFATYANPSNSYVAIYGEYRGQTN